MTNRDSPLLKKPRFLGMALNRDGVNEMATLKPGSQSGRLQKHRQFEMQLRSQREVL